jgi:hypothetical protein
MTMRMRTSQLVLAAFVALLLLLAIGQSRADAVGYQVWSCSNRITDDSRGSGADWDSNSGWESNFCPNGLEFPSGADLSLMGEFNWNWRGFVGDSVLSKVTLTMKGGSTAGGVVYEVAAGPSDPAFATLPARAVNAADLTTSVDVPEGVDTITLRARCAAATCTGSSPLRINEIKFRINDSRPPIADLDTAPYLNYSPDGATSDEIPWYRPETMSTGVRFREYGSGMQTASLTFDGPGTPFATKEIWSERATCASRWEFLQDAPPAIVFIRPDVCLGDLHPPKLISLHDLVDGRHKIELDSADAMDQTSDPVIGWFGIDSKPPPAPSNLHFSNSYINSHGWTTTPLVAAYEWPYPEAEPNTAPIDDIHGRIVRDDAPGTPRDFSLTGFPQGFPSEGHFRIEAWFTDSAGNRGDSNSLYVGFDTNKPPAPQLDENDWVSRAQLIDGYKQTWPHITPPENLESGICGYIVAFDREPVNTLTGEPTINGNVDSAPVPANLPEGHNFSHVASVSCAGLVSDTTNTPIAVDSTAPQVAVTGLPSGEWSPQPLHLTLEPSDELSGVDSIEWSLDGGSTHAASEAVEIEIGDGQHVLTTSATDRAGNKSAASSTVVHVDSTAPTSWLGQTAGARPNEFTAHVDETISGLDSAALEFQRIDAGATLGERQWRQAGAAYLPSGSPLGSHTFTRALDDSVLADGEYELQVVAVDRAGNVGHGSTLPVGGTVRVKLPLRTRPSIAMAISDIVRACSSKSKRGCASDARCRRGAKCTFKWVTTKKGAGIDRVVDWGDREALTGSLVGPSGKPLTGVKISIFSTPRAGSREFKDSVTTDGDGDFEWKIPKGATRSFAATTGATDDLASAETTATLAVRAGVSFGASDVSVHSGQVVRLSGKLSSGSVGVPAGGKQIQFQYWRDGKWRDGPGSTLTTASGRFHFDWPVTAISSRGTLFMRAAAIALPTESDWPFESGKSKPIRFSERP